VLEKLDFMVRFWQLKARNEAMGAPLLAAGAGGAPGASSPDVGRSAAPRGGSAAARRERRARAAHRAGRLPRRELGYAFGTLYSLRRRHRRRVQHAAPCRLEHDRSPGGRGVGRGVRAAVRRPLGRGPAHLPRWASRSTARRFASRSRSPSPACGARCSAGPSRWSRYKERSNKKLAHAPSPPRNGTSAGALTKSSCATCFGATRSSAP